MALVHIVKKGNPTFFYEIVNSEHLYAKLIRTFFEMLTEEEKQYAYFQQDNASTHKAPVHALEHVFDD